MAYNMDHRYETYAAAPKGKVNQTYPTSARKGNVDHTYPTYFAARKAPADGYHFLNTYEPAKKKPLRYPRTLWEKLSLPFKVNYYAPYYTRIAWILLLVVFAHTLVVAASGPLNTTECVCAALVVLHFLFALSPLVWGYVQPIYAGEYAFIHKWNAFSALFLTLLVAPCYLSFAKLMAVLLYAAAFFFQQGLPLPRRRFSTESFSNSISLRLFNALAFVPLAMTGEELAYLLMLIFFVLPPYFAQLMLDYGRLIDGLSAQERTERMLRQSVPARALYRRDDDYDDEAETGVLGKIYHMRRRLSDKLWDYLQQWDQLYDDLEEEERAAPGYYSAEERPWLERGDSDDELDADDENDAAVAEPSNRAQRPQPRATARGRPPARRPGRTATASRPINPRSVSARYDPVINPQQDPEDPAHALGFIIDETIYARDWDEALLDTANELVKDISGFVWGTMEALVGPFLAIIVAYYVYCASDFVVYRVWGIHLPDNAPVLALFGYLKSFWAGVVSRVGIRRIFDGVWEFRLKDTVLWRRLVRSLTWVSDGTVRRE